MTPFQAWTPALDQPADIPPVDRVKRLPLDYAQRRCGIEMDEGDEGGVTYEGGVK
jgi:hypothetical protein